MPPQHWEAPKQYFNDADIDAARRLFAQGLQELNISDESLPPLTLSYNTGQSHHLIAQALQQQWWEALGIKIRLQNTEWKVYLDKFSNCDFEIARMSWMVDYRDPLSYLDIFRYDQNGINCTRWLDPQYVALLNAADNTLDTTQRMQLLHNAEDIIMDNMPICPLFFPNVSYVKADNLHGVVISIPSLIDFKWAYLEDNTTL